MSRSFVSQILSGFGIMGTTVATVCSLAGVIGVISTTSAFCPEAVGPARCREAGSKAALIGAYGLTAAGLASCVFVAGRLIDDEA